MRARVHKPQELILFYNLTEEKRCGIAELCEELGIGFSEIMSQLYGQQVGYLAGWQGFSENSENIPQPEDCECLVFCGISGAKMNLLLAQLRSKGLTVDLKAAVTQYNQSWRFCDLLIELQKEHRQMHGI